MAPAAGGGSLQALGLAVTESVSAMVPGDFDNDGDLDLYVVTGGSVPEGVEVNGNQLLFRTISLPPGVLKGFRFTSTGTLTPTILVEGTANPNRVLLGRHRVPLARANWNGDPAQPVLEGRPEVNPETDRGVFLWRDEEADVPLPQEGAVLPGEADAGAGEVLAHQ